MEYMKLYGKGSLGGRGLHPEERVRALPRRWEIVESIESTVVKGFGSLRAGEGWERASS